MPPRQASCANAHALPPINIIHPSHKTTHRHCIYAYKYTLQNTPVRLSSHNHHHYPHLAVRLLNEPDIYLLSTTSYPYRLSCWKCPTTITPTGSSHLVGCVCAACAGAARTCAQHSARLSRRVPRARAPCIGTTRRRSHNDDGMNQILFFCCCSALLRLLLCC